MKQSILRTLSLVLVMLVTGIFWGTWFTLTRSLDAFPAENFLRIGKTIIRNVAVPMSIIMPLTIVILIWLYAIMRKFPPSSYFIFIALVLMILTTIITVAVEVPIDNQIKSWTVETIPPDWVQLRLKWNHFHTIRTFTSILSFVSLSTGVVWNHAAPEKIK
jgi:hypothetical protein